MNSEQRAIARRTLDRRLMQLKTAIGPVPPGGWLRAIRESLGMSTVQLADRLGVVQSRISMLESAERGGAPSLKTLTDAANAMGCELVYAIVPRTSLEELVRSQATLKADAHLARVSHSMGLENQSLTPEQREEERQRLINLFLNGSPRRLWDES